MAKNFELLDFYRQEGFTSFIFKETKELTEYVKNYYSETTTIEPVKHARVIKNLKSLIHGLSLSTPKSPSKNEFNNNKSKRI